MRSSGEDGNLRYGWKKELFKLLEANMSALTLNIKNRLKNGNKLLVRDMSGGLLTGQPIPVNGMFSTHINQMGIDQYVTIEVTGDVDTTIRPIHVSFDSPLPQSYSLNIFKHPGRDKWNIVSPGNGSHIIENSMELKSEPTDPVNVSVGQNEPDYTVGKINPLNVIQCCLSSFLVGWVAARFALEASRELWGGVALVAAAGVVVLGIISLFKKNTNSTQEKS